MSRAKDRARARAGNPHVSTREHRMMRTYVCAHCHKPGHFVEVDEYYYHEECPKKMIPFTKEELKQRDE